MFAMSLKLKLFSLVDAYASSNLPNLASVLRATHMQISYHYLKVFSLEIFPFNSLLLIIDTRLTANLRGSIKFLGCICYAAS